MSKTSLSAFMSGTPKEAPAQEEPARRTWVPITIKVHRDDHRRLRDIATAESSSTQELGTEGFNAALAARGLPPMRNYMDE